MGEGPDSRTQVQLRRLRTPAHSRNSIVTELCLDAHRGLGFASIGPCHQIYKDYNIMNSKYLIISGAFLLAVTGLRADFNPNTVVANALADPKNAPAIVALAVAQNPKSLDAIVAAVVAALPGQAAGIVQALLNIDPGQATQIVEDAIKADPKAAAQITMAAVTALPAQSAAIIAAATSVAPADLQSAVASPSGDGLGGNSTGTTPAASGFPSQPVQPDLVSPSS